MDRPHTREFEQEARERLGLAVERAREGAGHPYRPSFAAVAGTPLSVRTLLKLEKGEPVSAKVYEAAGRTLATYYSDWNVDTPLVILRGSDDDVPSGVPREEGAKSSDDKPSLEELDPDSVESLRQISPPSTFESYPSPNEGAEPAPKPAEYAGLEEYLKANIVHLIKMGLPAEAVLRAVDDVVTKYQEETAEGDSPNASGNGGSPNG
jgi:hypothetical protein